MQKKDFVILCLRLLGIYFIIEAFNNSPLFFLDMRSVPFGMLLTPFMYLLSGFSLFYFAPRLTPFIVTIKENEPLQISPNRTTARIAFILLGFYILSNALPHVIQTSIDLSFFFNDISAIPEHIRATSMRWTYLIIPVGKLIISLVLIIGPTQIISILSKYDTTLKGLDVPDEQFEKR